jgi:predicted ATP-grasp superfamily ATP-dependent carboligase
MLVHVEHEVKREEDLVYLINKIPKSFSNLNNYQEIINVIKDMFNVTVTLEQLEEYYSPNASEIEEDLRLQFKHLGYA